MTKAREISYSRFDIDNPEDVYEISEVSLPDLVGDREVLVRMSAAMVHPCDIGCSSGLVNGVNLPAVGGFEGIGVVEKIGSKLIEAFSPGQRVHVCATHIFGSWKEWLGVWRDYVILPPESLIPVPDEVEDDVAAQIFVNILTPLAMIKEMKLGTGDLVLQTAAGSVVGKVMIQLGQIFGFETINIVRRQETANEIIDLYGSNRVYVHDGTSSAEERLQNKIRNDIGDASIKYAIDAVSGEIGRFCLRMLDPGGLVYYYGALSGDPMVPVNIVTDLCRDNKTVKGWSIQETWLRSVSDSTKRTCVDEIWKFLSNKTIVLPPVGDKFPLEQVRQAIIASKKPQKKGKIMLVLDS